MNMPLIKQPRLKMKRKHKRDVRTQFAALCYRMKGEKLQIMLITSRTRGRWILPKGWPENGMTPTQAAAKEAYEEGGIKGIAYDMPLGLYSYSKAHGPFAGIPKIVMVFPVEVTKLSKSYPEKSQRQRKWFSPKAAAKRVEEPQLRKIIKSFDPSALQAPAKSA